MTSQRWYFTCSRVASCGRLLCSGAGGLSRCCDLLPVFVPPGWNVAEGSDLPGDLRLLGRAAAAGCAHPGPGPLLGLYESQPAPAELLLELLDQPSARPGFRTEGRRLQGGIAKKRKDGIFIESSSRAMKPSICWCPLFCSLSGLAAEGCDCSSIHVCRYHHTACGPTSCSSLLMLWPVWILLNCLSSSSLCC